MCSILILGLLCAATACATPHHHLNKLVVFGDSLSDNGNLYAYKKHQLPRSPPYYQGRFTNGLVWVERLTQAFYPHDWQAHLLDYAFGGADVLGEKGDVDETTPFTLSQEIDSYLLAHQNQADDQSLFIIWMGATNYLVGSDDLDETIHAVNQEITIGLQRLVDRGAQHILVINLPNLGRTPAAFDFDMTERLTTCTKTHNALLAKNTLQLQHDHSTVQWLLFDAERLFDQILDNPSRFGFSNTSGTCDDDTACDGYVFLDPIHPTAIAHRLISEHIQDLLRRSGITFT